MNEPPIRKPLDGFAIFAMVLLCLCWGFQQVAVKAAAPSMNPVLQLGIRSLIGALLVLVFMLLKRDNLSLRDGTLWPGFWVGLLFGGEFLAVSVGLIFTTASHMSVFLYTAPVFTAIGLHAFIHGEHLSFRQWLGVAVAFAGIIIAFSAGLLEESRSAEFTMLGDFLGVVSGALWASTTILIRGTSLSNASPAKTLLYQLVGAAVMLIPIAVVSGQATTIQLTPTLWLSLTFQSVVVAFLSFLAWFWLMTKYLASRLSVFSFLTPLIGVSLGVILLGDPLDVRFVVGSILVLAGIVIVNRRASD